MKSINHNWYLDIAEYNLKDSECLRRKYSALLVKNGKTISQGVNNPPEGIKSCKEKGFCMRDRLKIPRGQNYEICKSVHAEQKCIINSSKSNLKGSTLYLVGKESDGSYVSDAEPCFICKKLIIDSGIKLVVIRTNENEYRIITVQSWIDNGTIDNCIDTYANKF